MKTKNRKKQIFALGTMTLIGVSSIATVYQPVTAHAEESIRVISDTDALKQIQTSKVRVSLDNKGNYGMKILNPDSSVLFGGEFSSTSDIWVQDSFGTYNFRNLALESYKIKGDTLEQVRSTANTKFILRISIVNATATGGYMKVEVESVNKTASVQNMSTSIYWDTMVNGNDQSPFEIIQNGWSNFYNNVQVTAFFKDTYGVTDADSIWMGRWGQRGINSNPKSLPSSYTLGQKIYPGDSAAQFWYNSKPVQPNESRKASVILGIGPKNTPPAFTVTSPGEDGTYYRGQSFDIAGTAKDTVADKLTVKWAVDGGDENILTSLTADGTEQPFNYRYTLPEELTDGWHTLQVWAMDDKGGVSSANTKRFYVDTLRIATDKVESLTETVEEAVASGTLESQEGIDQVKEVFEDAKLVVSKVPEGDKKVELEGKLEVTKEVIDVAQGTLDTSLAENTLNLEDIEKAQSSVNELTDGEVKTNLQGRVDTVVAIVKVETLDKAVEEAVASGKLETQPGIDEVKVILDDASVSVNKVPEGNKKVEIEEKLEDSKEVIDVAQGTLDTSQAENTLVSEDVEKAQTSIDSMNDGEIKSNLQERIDTVKHVIKTTDSVTNLETLLTAQQIKLETSNLSGKDFIPSPYFSNGSINTSFLSPIGIVVKNQALMNELKTEMNIIQTEYEKALALLDKTPESNVLTIQNATASSKEKISPMKGVIKSVSTIITDASKNYQNGIGQTILIKNNKEVNLVDTYNLKITKSLGNTDNLHFVSFDNDILTVDQDGKMVAKSSGVGKVAIYNGNGVYNLYFLVYGK